LECGSLFSFTKIYRDGKKGMYILLSNTCLVLLAVVKQ